MDDLSASSSGDTDPNQSGSNGARDNGDSMQILSSNLKNLKLDKKSANSQKTTSLAEYKPEKWVLSNQEGILSQLNLAIVSYHRMKPDVSDFFSLLLFNFSACN